MQRITLSNIYVIKIKSLVITYKVWLHVLIKSTNLHLLSDLDNKSLLLFDEALEHIK